MRGLEEEIDDLVGLGELRRRARRLRASAIHGIASRSYSIASQPAVDVVGSAAEASTWWDGPTDAVELALLLSVERVAVKRSVAFEDASERRRFSNLRRRAFGSADDEDAGCLTSEHLRPGAENDEEHSEFLDEIPTLRCSRVLHELTARPGYALGIRAILSYYRVLTEIYATGHPDWVIGSARASGSGAATAFITNECVRGILSMRASMERSALFCEAVARYLEATERAQQVVATGGAWLEGWAALERERAATAFVVDFNSLRRSLLFNVGPAPSTGADGSTFAPTEVAEVDRLVQGLAATVRPQLSRGAMNLGLALIRADEWRNPASPSLDPRHAQYLALTASAHQIAHLMILRGKSDLEAAAKTIATDPCGPESWRGLARVFRAASTRVRRVLRPTTSYVSSVMDREIAAAESPGSPACDCPELAFAATAYGAITGRWTDARLVKAARVLEQRLEEDGTFPRGRPFQSGKRGYILHAAPSETIRAFARLIQMVDYPLPRAAAEKLLRFYERTKITITPDDSPIGFGADVHAKPRVVSWWASALAVNALDRIVRMLSAVIKRRVLAHFNSLQFDQLPLSLDQLVPGDYGLSSVGHGPGAPRRLPLSFHLQRVRAHLLDSQLPPWKTWEHAERKPVWSVVLFGPPGTGKTTALQALARSAGRHFTFVTVTPSDIVMRGTEQVEMQARLIMKALSLLTDAVILFDEFDEFIRRRSASAPQEPSVFEFITPGMLTKFHELYEASEENRVAYALATNMVAHLDDAAIRDGRFDLKVGVYPPDLLSRCGCLVSSTCIGLLDWTPVSETPEWNRERRERIAHAVELAASGTMTTLGRPGWLTRPAVQTCRADAPSDGTLFDYICERLPAPPPRPGREFDGSWGTPKRVGRRLSARDFAHPWSPEVKELVELHAVLHMDRLLSDDLGRRRTGGWRALGAHVAASRRLRLVSPAWLRQSPRRRTAPGAQDSEGAPGRPQRAKGSASVRRGKTSPLK